MRPFFPRSWLAGFLFAAFALIWPAAATAQVYWNVTVTAGAAPGTWDQGTTSAWSTNANGGSADDWATRVVNSTPTIANFSAGTNATGSYTVTVSGNVGDVTSGWIGGIVVDEGTVTFGGTGTLYIRGSGIDNNTANLITLGANVNLVAAQTWDTGTGGITQSGTSVISGTSNLTKAGSGTLTLGGTNANTNSGTFAVNDGTVVLNKSASTNATGTGAITIGDSTGAANSAILRIDTNNEQINNTSAVTINSDGQFNVNGRTETVGSIASASSTASIALGAGTLTAGGNNNTTTFAGVISDTGNFTKAGTGVLTLSGTNTYTGVTTLSGGKLSVGTIGNGGVAGNLGQAANTADRIVFNGGTLLYTGSTATSDRAFTINAATTATIEVDSAGTNLTLAGATGTTTTGGLTKTGAGTLTLSGNSTYTGVTTLSGGTLSVATIGNGGVAGGLGQASNAASNLVFNGGTLQYTGGSTTSNRAFTINAATTATIDVDNASATLSLAGATGAATTGALTKTGAGTLTISGSTTNTGATTINAGTLKTSTADRIADTSNLAINNSGTFEMEGNEIVGALSGNSGTANLNLKGNTFTTSTTSNTQYQGGITGWGTFVKAGTGDLTLSGNSSFSGITNITGGTLIMAHNNALGTSYNVTISNGATLGLQGDITAGLSTLNLQGTGDGSVGAINNISGANTLGSALNFAAATTIGAAGGTLTLSGSINQSQALTMQVSSGATIEAQGNIYGSSSLTKTGSGTLTFTGSNGNSASGGVAINDGTVVLQRTAGTSAIGQGAVAVGDNSGTAGTAILRLGANNQINDENIVTIGANDGRFDLNGYTEGIRQLQGTGGQVTLGAGSLTIGTNAAGNSAFAGVISGTGGSLTKMSNSTLALSGTSANTYTGATNVTDGTLTLGKTAGLDATGTGALNIGDGSGSANSAIVQLLASNQINNASAVTIATDGKLDLNGFSETIGAITGAGNIALGSGTLTIGDATSFTYGGVVSGTGGLTKVGAGTVTLSGTNTYTGVTTLSAGTLSVGTIGNGGVAGNLGQATNAANRIVFNSGTLQYTGATASSNRAFTLTAGTTGTIDVSTAGTNLTLAGATGATTTGGLTKTGAGTLTLSGNSTYTGVTTLTGGTLSVATIGNGGVAGGLGQASNAANRIVFNGGALKYTGATASSNRRFTINAATNGTIEVDSASANLSMVGATGTATTGSLTKLGAGTLTFTGAQTNTGGTTIGTAGVSGVSGGTLSYGVNNTLSSGAVTVYAGTLAVNTYTDTIGALNLGGSGVGTTAAVTLGNGGVLTLGGNVTYDGSTGANGATINKTGTTGQLALGASRTFTVGDSVNATDDLSISAIITGTGFGITKLGAGNLVLNGANLYTGATNIGSVSANGGTLTYGVANALSTGAVFVYDGTFATGNFSDSIGALTVGGGAASSTAAVTIGASTLSTAAVTLGGGGAGSTSTISIGNGGSLALGGNVTYSATNDPNGATISGTGTGSLALGANRTFTIGDSANAAADLTVSAIIANGSGSRSINKDGAGTLVLSGANTYSGTTTIADGTLVAANDSALGAATANVTVSSGATLSIAGGVNATKSTGTLSIAGTGDTGQLGALVAGGTAGQTSQYTGNITLTANSTIGASNNLLIIGDDYDYDNRITLGSNTLTLSTTSATGVVPVYDSAPSYILDESNLYISSTITGTGGVTKTGDGTANLIFFPSSAGVASYTGNTLVTGGKLIIDGADHGGIVSTNIVVGNASSPGGDDSVVLQMGQLASPPSSNYLVGDYNNITNVATSSMTVYEDGLFNMNRANNALVNLTMRGGHVTGRLDADSYSLLTVTGGITTQASAQASVIDHGELGLSANGFTFTVADGAATEDLRIDSIIHNGIGFTATDADASLVKTGTGTMVFTAANDYQGVTQVQQGVLVIRNNDALGIFSPSVGNLNNGTVVSSGAQLQLQETTGGADLTIGGVSGTETLTLSGTGIGDTGALYNATGDNTYHGFVRLAADSRITAASGTLLTIANTAGTEASIMNGTGGGGQDLSVGGPGDVTIGSAIGGLLSDISKDGTGTLTLAGNNSYVGTTKVYTDGAIKVTHNQGLAGSGVTVNDGGALQFAKNAANQSLTAISGPSSGTTTISGTGLSNGGAIQNLTGDNTYLGGVTLAANSRITADSGSSLTFSGNLAGTASGYDLDAGGAGNTTYNGFISGTGTTFTKTDTGTVTLGGTSANTFTGGLYVNEGTLNLNKTAGTNAVGTSNTITIGDNIGSALSATLALQKNNQMPDTTDITINLDGRLSMGTSSDAVSQIAGTGQIDLGTAGHLTIGGDNSSSIFDGTFETTSTGTFTKSGTGDLTFTQDISYDGTFNLGGGKLILDDMDLTVTNLNITADSTIDFGPDGNSHIFATTLSFLNTDIKLNIVNWTWGVDAFYSTYWPGATYDLVNNSNTVPMSQITFAGWDKSDTGWDSYDDQIYPKVPEPSTYGLMFMGACVAFFGYRRWRAGKKTAVSESSAK